MSREAHASVRERAKRALFRWACIGPAANFGRAVLRYWNWQPMQVSTTGSAAEKSMVVAPQSQYTVQAPRRLGQTPLLRSGVYPTVKAHLVKQAIVSAYSPAYLRDQLLCLPEPLVSGRTRIQPNSDGLFEMDQRIAVGRLVANTALAQGILIGGAGAFNWYHFVIECLPKAHLAHRLPEEFSDFPLLVPDECRHVPSFAAALSVVAGERQVCYLRKGEQTLVDRLVVFDEISVGPFNLYAGQWPRIDDYRQSDELLREYFAELRSGVLGAEAPIHGGRRTFLKRSGASRRFNQDELLEVARNEGFEEVHLEALSLVNQARVFAESSVVVGASGAAWVGMFFRERPLVGLSWLPSFYEQFCAYSSLARLLGHRLGFLESRARRPVASTRAASGAEYWVSPVEFERAIKNMLGEVR